MEGDSANLIACIAGSGTSAAERPSRPATHVGKVELQGDLQLLRMHGAVRQKNPLNTGESATNTTKLHVEDRKMNLPVQLNVLIADLILSETVRRQNVARRGIL